MKLYLTLLIAVITFATISCTGSHHNHEDNKNIPTVQNMVPPLVTFCKNINYSDTAALHNERLMKRTVAQIVKMLASSDSVSARTGLTIFFNSLRHDEKALSLATGFADLYLNNLASPVRNEEKYISVLSTLLAIDSIPDYERELATERLRIASLNRRGTIANDFRFEKPDGSLNTLHDIESPLTLMVFYDPECSHCSAILAEIAANKTVNAAVSDGRLTVIAIYTEGKRDVWRNNLGNMPSNWIIGYDRSAILDNDLYDIPAMPTLYLLDSDKRVIMKDPDHRLVSKYLRKLNSNP